MVEGIALGASVVSNYSDSLTLIAKPETLAGRLHALERFVPYGANYDRGVADEFHTALRLIAERRADEAEYFVGLAERAASRHGGV